MPDEIPSNPEGAAAAAAAEAEAAAAAAAAADAAAAAAAAGDTPADPMGDPRDPPAATDTAQEAMRLTQHLSGDQRTLLQYVLSQLERLDQRAFGAGDIPNIPPTSPTGQAAVPSLVTPGSSGQTPLATAPPPTLTPTGDVGATAHTGTPTTSLGQEVTLGVPQAPFMVAKRRITTPSMRIPTNKYHRCSM